MDSLEQAIFRHQIYIQRLSSSEIKKMMPVMKKMMSDIRGMVSGTHISNELEMDVYALMGAISNEMGVKFVDLTSNLVQYELQFMESLLGGHMTVELNKISTEVVIQSVTNNKMVLTSGKKVIRETMTQAVKRFTDTAAKDVIQTIRSAAILGDPLEKTKIAVVDMVKNRTVSQSQSLVRTVTNHITSNAREKFYETQADFLEGEKWSSTLDGHTTETCMALDGQTFPVGQGRMPPAHYQCRSVRVPIIKDEFRIPGYKKGRSSMGGPVDSSLTYDGFLRKQSKEFQDDTLGIKKANLFRSGVPISRFTDDMGRSLTIDQIRQREGLTG